MSVRLSAPRIRGGMSPVDRVLLRRRARRALDAIDHARSELSITLVEDDAMARLNSVHRGVAGPTDVLSFSLLEGDETAHRGELLGDVVIALGVAQAQARRGRRSLDDELARLLIHGVLHLVGHDHGRVREALAMRREERRLWRAVCAGGSTRGGLTLTRPPVAARAPYGAKAAKSSTTQKGGQRSRTTSRHA
jgi:rRNA maturation RNase YbeY